MRTLRRSIALLWLAGEKAFTKAQRLLRPPLTAAVHLPGTLQGRVVVITGSSRGIGLALAHAFARHGATLVMHGRQADDLASARRSVEATGARVESVLADLATADGAELLMQRAQAAFGGIDVLINNAAVIGPIDRPAADVSDAQWREVWSVNVDAVMRCVRAAALGARHSGRPVRILNVSSGVAGKAAPRLGPYAVSKDAVESLSRAFAMDNENGLLCVASIQPPAVRTQMTRGYYGAARSELMPDPQSVAAAFLWAAAAPVDEVNGRNFQESECAAKAAAVAAPPGQDGARFSA